MTAAAADAELRDYYSGKRVMMTGGLGFIGSNLAHRLVELGARPELIDNFLPNHGANPVNIGGIEDRVTVRRADVRSADDMDRILPGADVVFHLAAQADHGASLRQPQLDFGVNVLGTVTVLESLRRVGPGTRFIYCGTRSEYGSPKTIPVAEDSPVAPLDLYSADKYAAGLMARLYHRLHGLAATWIRLSNTYGPRAQMLHPGYGILNWFIRTAMDDRPITIYGDGRQLRDYTYVEDIADAFCRVAACGDTVGGTFNLGHPEPLPLVELARKIIEAAGSGDLSFVPWPEGRKRTDVGDYSTDSGKLRSLIGWSPMTGIDDGLRRTVDYYRERRDGYWKR